MHIPQHYQSLRNSYITLDTSLRRTCSFGNQMLHHFLSGKVPGKCQQSHWMIVSLGPRHHLADIKTVCNVSLFHFLNSLLKVIILIILNGLWQTGIVVKLHLICPYNIIIIRYDRGLRMRRLPCGRYLLALHSEPFYSLTCSWKCSH